MANLAMHRRFEWWFSSATLIWGLAVTFIPTVLHGPPLFIVRIWAEHGTWGMAATLIGLFHIWALIINGRKHWSPYVRLAAALASTLVFGLFFAGMAAAIWHGISPPELTLIAQALFVHASVCAFWVAACDSYSAFRCPQPEVQNARS